MINNCCMWNKKLKDTFIEQTEVKLDLFHAVKRIMSALSKPHTYFYSAIQEFMLVFRSHGDNGVQRTKHSFACYHFKKHRHVSFKMEQNS